MAGHNKWSKVKHKKAREDARKGKIFTRLAREIEVAVRAGGPDPAYNAALRAAIANAKAENMPNENIERAIKRGSGELGGDQIEEVFYEGYGPEGVAILVKCLTDKKNRTVSEVRHTFSKAGGSLGESNCVAWMFERIGVVTVVGDDEERVMEAAIEAGAEDVRPGPEEGTWEVVCADRELASVQSALEAAGWEIRGAGIRYEPKTTVQVAGAGAERVLRLINALEDLDDVQEVYANFEIADEELERLAASL